MRTLTIGLSAACLMMALAGCNSEPTEVVKTAAKPAEPAAQSPWDAEVRAAAEQYKTWQRVSDKANWAPFLCGSPPPSGTLVSKAPSTTPHGRKLYYLFVKDAPSYFKMAELSYDQDKRNYTLPADVQQPVGQVVIKEAHMPEPATLTDASKAMTQTDYDQRRIIPPSFASTDDGLFRTGEPAGLFAMLKVAPDTAGTDQGWVYATVSPAGDITSIGAVESCMDCHIKAPSDRLFGPQWTQEFQRAKPPAR